MNTMNRNEGGAPLSDNTVRNLRVAKIFQENPHPSKYVNYMDFSNSGDMLISSSLDDKIVIYDCEKGVQKYSLFSKKYGVDLIHFTHAANAVVHVSTKIDDTIRYLSLHDNKYIRYFVGHTKRVNNLSMSPTDDSFLTTSLDQTLRLWDLRTRECQAVMNFNGQALTSFDPEGLIFAVGINSESIKLYDARSYSKGPFMHFMFPYDNIKWSSLKFSPNGKLIMINTHGSLIRLVDSFRGLPVKSLSGHFNIQNLPLEASFSPDSQYIFSGSSDGQIHVWNVNEGYKAADYLVWHTDQMCTSRILSEQDGNVWCVIENWGIIVWQWVKIYGTMSAVKVCSLDAMHPGPVHCMKFNPKYMMLATSCSNMVFWLPHLDDP